MNPMAGQRFRSLDNISVRGLIHLRAPATGSFAGTLPRGEVVVVDLEPPAHATAVSVRPLRYCELELSLVPSEDRADPKYASYSLVIPLELLLKGFEPVPGGTFIVLLDEPGLFVFQTAADA